MTTVPDEPQDADPTQLEEAGEAIDEAKAAAGRVAKDENIDTGGDLPSEEENFPSAARTPDAESAEDPEGAEGAAAADDTDAEPAADVEPGEASPEK
jgi:hypothetical protein